MISAFTAFRGLVKEIILKITKSFGQKSDGVAISIDIDGGKERNLCVGVETHIQIKQNFDVSMDKDGCIILGINLENIELDTSSMSVEQEVFSSIRYRIGCYRDEDLTQDALQRVFSEEESKNIHSLNDTRETMYYRMMVEKLNDIIKNADVSCTLGSGQFPNFKNRKVLPVCKVNLSTRRVSYFGYQTGDYKKGRCHTDLEQFLKTEYFYTVLPTELLTFRIKHKYVKPW